MDFPVPLPFGTLCGPLAPLTAGFIAERRPLSLWRTPTRDGTLDVAAFRRALAWATRSESEASRAAENGARLRDALAVCRQSAACHAMPMTRSDLAPCRVLLLPGAPAASATPDSLVSLIREARQHFPDAVLYWCAHGTGVLSGRTAEVDVRALPFALDVGQLAVLFDDVVTNCSSYAPLMQCLGVKVTTAGQTAVLPDDETEANIWLHVLFEKLAVQFDPVTNLPAPALQIVRLVTDRLRQQRLSRQVAVFTGIHFWKRDTVAAMFAAMPKTAAIQDSARHAVERAKAAGGAVGAWASTLESKTIADCREQSVPLFRMEDGFIRSVGLGAAGFRSLSFVLDDLGIHFDSGSPSRLETILQTAEFNEGIRQRAADLRARLTRDRLTKYNLSEEETRLTVPAGKRVILVPGQVDDDASIILAGGGLNGKSLLQAARRLNPESFIIYKPHPDVINGLRRGFAERDEALKLADLYVERQSMVSLLDIAEEVHTISSLTGFEALLRGCKVVCHGQPFYSGWGLTEDLRPVARRTRNLTLDELVAGALILYPHYLDPVTGENTTPEVVIDRLVEHRKKPPSPHPAVRLIGMVRHFWRRSRLVVRSRLGFID